MFVIQLPSLTLTWRRDDEEMRLRPVHVSFYHRKRIQPNVVLVNRGAFLSIVPPSHEGLSMWSRTHHTDCSHISNFPQLAQKYIECVQLLLRTAGMNHYLFGRSILPAKSNAYLILIATNFSILPAGSFRLTDNDVRWSGRIVPIFRLTDNDVRFNDNDVRTRFPICLIVNFD